MSDHEWTEREQKELRAMREESMPRPEMEHRVIEALRARGQIRHHGFARWWGIAAALLLFAAGFGAGSWKSHRSAPGGDRSQFVLFLYGSESSTGSVAEHKAWARQLASEGKLAGGEKLTQESFAADGSASAEPIGGFFVIQAADWPQALEMARSCPHARHGGKVVVRKIDPV